MGKLTTYSGLEKVSDKRKVKGTVIYQMKSYADATRIHVRSCDIILGVDRNGLTWILIRQKVR